MYISQNTDQAHATVLFIFMTNILCGLLSAGRSVYFLHTGFSHD